MQAWPEDALEMVANKFLEDVDLEDNVRLETVTMCKHFHESVRKISEKYVVCRTVNYQVHAVYIYKDAHILFCVIYLQFGQ